MPTLLLLLIGTGLAPLAVGTLVLSRTSRGMWPSVRVGSVILCALAFNLTFLWQELWLVIPKALTAGLHPILYHNNHDWSGHAPKVELLQGTGALATLAGGLACSGALAVATPAGVTWRLFLFWMAFEGLYQSLTQLAIGTLMPGNDVGRALAYLRVGVWGAWTLLAFSVIAMALTGAWLARVYPLGGASARGVAATALLAIVFIVPFRVPRDVVEVALIPLFVNLVGAGWLTLGVSSLHSDEAATDHRHVGFVGPALALGLTLLFFQSVLRRGIAF